MSYKVMIDIGLGLENLPLLQVLKLVYEEHHHNGDGPPRGAEIGADPGNAKPLVTK